MSGVRFVIDEDKKAVAFAYRPSNSNVPVAHNETMGVKFGQKKVILDAMFIIGGTKWSRTVLRIKNPIIYSMRGLRNLYRRIKQIFIKPHMIPLRTSKENVK